MNSQPIDFLYEGHHYSYILNDDLHSVIEILDAHAQVVYDLALDELIDCTVTSQSFLVYDKLQQQFVYEPLPCYFDIYTNAAGYKVPRLNFSLNNKEKFSSFINLKSFFADLLKHHEEEGFTITTNLPSLEEIALKMLPFLNKNVQDLFVLGYQVTTENDLPVNLLFDKLNQCFGVCRFNPQLTTPTLTAYTPIKLNTLHEPVQCITPFCTFILEHFKLLQQIADTKCFQYSFECTQFTPTNIHLLPNYDSLAACAEKYNQKYPFKMEQYTKENVLYPFKKRR